MAARLGNVFETVLTGEEGAAVADIRRTLRGGALGTVMSGSGPHGVRHFRPGGGPGGGADPLGAVRPDVSGPAGTKISRNGIKTAVSLCPSL